MQDIFLNTPNQAAWFERFVTDWTGPTGRLGRMKFRMRDSIFPGDTMTFTASVTDVTTDETGCGWAGLESRCRRRVPNVPAAGVQHVLRASPFHVGRRQPWSRRGDQWKP